MKRLLKTIQRIGITTHQNIYLNSSSRNVPINSKQPHQITQKKPHQSLTHLYGIKVDQHVLLNRRLKLTQSQYQFYQKASPNYLVALVKKVIDNVQNNQIQTIMPIDQFYRISTYCHVKYLQNNNIQLHKLHKVKIEDIKKLECQKISNQIQQKTNTNTQDISSIQQQQQHKQQTQLTINPISPSQSQPQSQSQSKNKNTIRNLIKKSYPSKLNQLSQFYYYLNVKKIQQLPLIINQKLQVKFKYLLDTYVTSYKNMNTQTPPGIRFNFNIKDINANLDWIAVQLAMLSKIQDIQLYLQANNPQDKIDILLKLLYRGTNVNNYFNQIQNQAKNIIRNKKYYQYYSQMMKVAKQILDGKKTKQLFIQKCKKNFKLMNPTKQIIQIFNQEIQKYQQIDQNSMQAGVIKNYIQQLSKIPYDIKSQEIFDLQFAQKVMDQQHYGMKEVKDSILQVIAVGKLKKTLKGKIFCFIGGPGLGKTSFAKSVARALNRKFYNISLGGASDSSVLKGHRRTYVGAYSGKIIQALKNCGTSNPVILLDQIDKMGSSYHGDPRSQLLQILDPNQNNSFVDNYVDVPIDLSNVLFITSANYQRNISKPLLDRMEKIYLNSYTKAQKVQIFKKHLLKRAISKTGVQQNKFDLQPEVIDTLVQQYSLGQPGVRYLQKHALSLLQKVAYKMLTNQQQVPIKITKQNLYNYLGNSYYRRKDHNNLAIGMAISLGGGDYGSRLTYIQAFKKSYLTRKQINRGALFTGSLGDIFKEAMNISYTYARNFLLQNFNNKYLYENQIHVHAPQGAFKKDGSTDSLTIVTALISLALKTKVKPGVAMTGQITLNGHLLRTYGIKQKIMVAKRQRIREVVLPKGNEPDVANLSKDITQDIKFHYVSEFSEAFSYLFTDLANKKVAVENKA